MARPANTVERRRQITAALAELMASRGYDGTSVAAIAEVAGIAPGLVHYHFQNKQEILLELLADLVTRHRERLDEHLAASPAFPAEQVAGFIDAHLDLSAADPKALACWILLSGEALRQPEVQGPYGAALQELVDSLAVRIEWGLRSREFFHHDAKEAAAAIVAAIQGYFVLAATAPTLIPTGSAAHSVRAMAEGLLQAKLPPEACL